MSQKWNTEYDPDEYDGHDYEEEYGNNDDDAEALTIECIACGAEIHEDATTCPICGEYVMRDSTSMMAGKPMWYIALALAGILAVIAVLSGLLALV